MDQHWMRKQWPVREQLIQGDRNIINQPLVSRDRVILPPLHIRLELMKQFMQALDQRWANCCSRT